MICPKCQTALPEGANFCLKCGHGLKADTPAPQPPYSAPEPERKHVTALFSDLTSYTTITEKLDPEQVKKITAAVFAGIKQISAKYEALLTLIARVKDAKLSHFPRIQFSFPSFRVVYNFLEIYRLTFSF